MRSHFAAVLARESASLAGVTDGAELAGWRRRVVRELMTPQSPYALALRQTGDVPGRADFLCRWRGLLAEAVDRLQRRSSARRRPADVDAQETAVLILAALHGGSTLSRVTRDPWPLNAALDLALARIAASADIGLDGREREQPDQ